MNGEPRPQTLAVLNEVPDNWPTPTRGVKRQLPKFEYVSPTYVIRMSNPEPSLEIELSRALGEHGGTFTYGTGFWEGETEPDVAITIQAEPDVLRTVLQALANWYPKERYLHVEKHDVPTSYVDLDSWR